VLLGEVATGRSCPLTLANRESKMRRVRLFIPKQILPRRFRYRHL
jgi:hypothetical protein